MKIGVKMVINEADLTDIQAEIEGPVGTPYEGGIFRCKLAVENDFPVNPPKGTLFRHSRLLHNEDLPSQRLRKRRDLRQHAQERLEPRRLVALQHPRGRQVPPHRPLPRKLTQ